MKRRLTCCCCGEDAGTWEQHWNRDTGYGVCAKCVDWVRSRGESEEEIRSCYGIEGINWGRATNRTDTAHDKERCPTCGTQYPDLTFRMSKGHCTDSWHNQQI